MSAAVENIVNRLNELAAKAQEKLISKMNLEEVESLRVEWLGKKGLLTEIMKGVGQLSATERPVVGQKANAVRDGIAQSLDQTLAKLREEKILQQLETEKIDVSLPGRRGHFPYAHPVQIAQDELVSILERSGFLTEVGPEIEHEFYNFDALNIPPQHPSRALQDTFYVKGHEGVVLRTHTSPVQIRTLLALKPPIRMCCPGRVFRSDYDATHSPMFHQIEGLLVDQGVTMADLKGILTTLISEFFGQALKVRLRPSFFPFTEPSAEVDMECCFCKGKGCSTCKGSGWIEIGGSGMVDPEVFKAVGYDTEIYSGFAFGMGIDRMAMLRFGISDLRAFYESDLRFISQFARLRP